MMAGRSLKYFRDGGANAVFSVFGANPSKVSKTSGILAKTNNIAF